MCRGDRVNHLGKDLLVRYGAIRTTVELKSIYRHFSKLSPGSPTYIVPPPPPGIPPRKREINNIWRIISHTQTSHNALLPITNGCWESNHISFTLHQLGGFLCLYFLKVIHAKYCDSSNHRQSCFYSIYFSDFIPICNSKKVEENVSHG